MRIICVQLNWTFENRKKWQFLKKNGPLRWTAYLPTFTTNIRSPKLNNNTPSTPLLPNDTKLLISNTNGKAKLVGNDDLELPGVIICIMEV